MNFSPQELHGVHPASVSRSSFSNVAGNATSSSAATSASSAAMADPNTLLISSIAGAVDSIFGSIGSAIKGKTKRDLMRQQGNQQLVQNAVGLHSQRLQNAQPKAKPKNHTPMIILGLMAVLVFTILVFTLKKP